MTGGTNAAANDDVLSQLGTLGDLIDNRAAGNEDATEIDAEVVAALEEAGLLGLMVPQELGGGEADPATLIDAIAAMSYHDGSTGWYAGAIMTAGAVAGAFLGDRAIDAIFHGPGTSICAGQAAPTGKAERVGDSYRISGRFAFGSGTPSAGHMVGGYILHEDGEPVMADYGAPVMLIGFAPRETVEFHGNWDVMGLRGTGSYDFTVSEQLLHEDYFFDPATTAPKRGGALYKMGFMAMPTLTHGSFAVGCGRRILDEWRDFAKEKARGPGQMAYETPTYQRDFAVAHGELRAAEAYLRRTFGQLFAAARNDAVTDDMRIDGRLCSSHAVATGAKIAQNAFSYCTTSALRNGNAIQRCFRDLQAGNAHFMTGEGSFIEAGRVLGEVPEAQLQF